MKLGVPKESGKGERRVAIVPAVVPQLVKMGCEVLVERGAGAAAGLVDSAYEAKGAQLVDRDAALGAEIVAQVRMVTDATEEQEVLRSRMHAGQTVLAMCDPLGHPQGVQEFAATGATLFALEMIPRTTRAQSMDVLSSMASLAGYRAVLLAALELPQMFPLMMTAAGTISPAKVLIIGAGVAGLQAIATAKRLGAVVQAYDVRPAVREQIESLGGRFVELPLETGEAEDKGGYAKALGEEFYEKQRALLADVIADCDVVVSTAAIPGKTSPLLITEEAVQRMRPGSVIIDLAAERGGNCRLSQPDAKVVEHGVSILGPTNLPSDMAYDASQMFARNITNFLTIAIRDGELRINRDDEIINGTLVAYQGEVCHPQIRELLGLEPLTAMDESERPIKLDE
jgi:NAD(P) transhydrogenase subunit alpha